MIRRILRQARYAVTLVAAVAAMTAGVVSVGGAAEAASITTTQLQWDLAGLSYLPLSGIDGVYGSQTTSAVKAFQSDQCLSVDGIAGSQTDGALSAVIKLVQDTAGATSDGMYGPGTQSHVATWQSQHNLSADGIAGPNTMAAMLITRNHQCGGPSSGSPSPGSSTAAQLQWDLAGLGYLPWSGIDGIIGPQTAGATQAFQTDRCLAVDGIAGPQTNGALLSVIQQVQGVAGTTADGYYGPNTRAAVASWQSAHGLTADGQAGPLTMSAMGITRVVSCGNPPSGGNPPPGDMGAAIASVATAQLNDSSRNHEAGGYNCNFYSTVLGVGQTGQCSNGWRTEAWCADFAKWVWAQAGVNVGGLDPRAASFYHYGLAHGTWHSGTPRVGDAVVFNLSSDGSYAQHVGLVVAVGSGTFTMISGNTYNPADGLDDIVGQATLNDSDASIAGFADPVSTAPANNNKTAFDYFRNVGLTSVQAAAIVGNFNQESGAVMDPTAVQPGGPGRGIAQWGVGQRWDTYANDNMVWYANAHGSSPWALTPQLQFTWYELSTYSYYGLSTLRNQTTVYNAVVAFQNDFEGCGVCMTDNRVRFANQALAYYG